MANPCDDNYAEELAKSYLVTPTGNSTQDPTGIWCTPGDVTQWKLAVIRIRRAMQDTASQNKGKVSFSPDLAKRIGKWTLQSLRLPEGGFFPHAATRVCEADVAKNLDMAQRGVSILAAMHCEAQQGNGVVPDLPPEAESEYDPGLPGPDAAWYIGGGLLALGLVYLIVRGR